MPLPTLLCLAFASGLAAAAAARSELRVSPRPSILTRSFFAYMLFVGLLLVPASIYFYFFHGDWFLLYVVDARRIPSAVALLGFLVEAAVGTAGFALGAALVRSQRETLGGGLMVGAVLGGAAVAVVARDRLAVVGSFAQYRGGFGLTQFAESPVLKGTVLAGAVLALGIGGLLVRLRAGGRRT